MPPDLVGRAVFKLGLLDKVPSLDALRDLLGNRLKPFKADRLGQHPIRVNDLWRLSFVWTERGPNRIELGDYHR